MEWKIYCDRTVVREGLRGAIIEAAEGASEMGRKNVRSFLIARVPYIRLDENPVEPEFSDLHLPPSELGREAGSEPSA